MATGSALWVGLGGPPTTNWEWDGAWNPAQHPADGDTATFDGNEAIGLPDTNLPAAGTIHFTFTGAYMMLDISTLLNGAALGLIISTNAGSILAPGMDFAGATITNGYLHIGAAHTSSAGISIAGKLQLSGVLMMDPGMDAALQTGGQLVGSGGVLDGDLIAAGNATVNWGTGNLDIIGSFDADGNVITHSNTATGNSLTCDIAGNLDLGSIAVALDSLDIEIQAATVATAAVRAKSWEMTAGTYNDGGLAHDIVGDMVVTGGVMAATTGTWTMTGSGNIRGLFDKLILASAGETTTTTGNVTTNAVTLGAGTLAGTHTVIVYLSANNLVVQDAANTLNLTGVGYLRLYPQAVTREVAAINMGTTDLRITGNDLGVKMTGALSSTGVITVRSAGAGSIAVLDMNAKTLTAGDITLGDTDANNLSGSLALGAISTITGNVIGGNAANKVNNTLTIPAGGLVNLSGSITGTNIDTITAGAGVVIQGGGTLTACDGDPGNVVMCYGMTDGGGNHANYHFGGGTRMALTGVGT